MPHMIRFFVLATVCGVDGWWWHSNHTATEKGPWHSWLASHSPKVAEAVDRLGDQIQRTWDSVPEVKVGDWTFQPSGGLWWLCDSLVGLLGWLVFGTAWGDVKLGVRRLVQIGAILLLCVLAHYVWAVCYPIVTLVIFQPVPNRLTRLLRPLFSLCVLKALCIEAWNQPIFLKVI